MQLLDQALTIAEDARKVCDSNSLIRSSDDLTQILWPPLAAVQVVSTRRTRMACNNGLQSRDRLLLYFGRCAVQAVGREGASVVESLRGRGSFA